MRDDSNALLKRLKEWERHLRALVPDDEGDGVVAVRPILINLLIEDLARTYERLASHEELAETVRSSLTEWVGSAHALREISRALDAEEE